MHRYTNIDIQIQIQIHEYNYRNTNALIHHLREKEAEYNLHIVWFSIHLVWDIKKEKKIEIWKFRLSCWHWRKRNDGWTEKGWPGFSLFPVARKKDDDGGDDDDLRWWFMMVTTMIMMVMCWERLACLLIVSAGQTKDPSYEANPMTCHASSFSY